MPSPSRFPSSTSTPQLDESRLTEGQCHYVFMIPKLKGQRCDCMGFVHNKARPGVTCHCGHLPCFHVSSVDTPSLVEDRAEVELIMQRIRKLGERMNRNVHDRPPRVISRIDQLEETVKKIKDGVSAEVRGSYINASAAWQLVSQLQQIVERLEENVQSHDEQMTKTGIRVDDLINRQLQLLDRGVMMEERIEKLERTGPLLSLPQGVGPNDTLFATLHLSPTSTTNTQQQTTNPSQHSQTFQSPASGPL